MNAQARQFPASKTRRKRGSLSVELTCGSMLMVVVVCVLHGLM